MKLNILPGTQGNTVQNSLNFPLPQTGIPIELSINTNESWVYCNFPEHINREEMLADKFNVRINRQMVNAGDVQVFYSHVNHFTKKIRYGIRIYNPNSTNVTITPTNCGHSDGTWDDVCGGSWKRFFNGLEDCNIKSVTTVPSNGSLWIMDKSIRPAADSSSSSGIAFSGNLRFHTTKAVAVSTYVYFDRSKVGDNTQTYSYANTYESDEHDKNRKKRYSGLGEGFFFTTKKITLKASELLKTNGAYFSTHQRTYSSPCSMKVNNINKSELIPIYIAGTNMIASVDTNKSPNEFLRNIGNWCAQYYIPIRLENDLNYPVIFNGYVRTDVAKTTIKEKEIGSTFIISSGGNTTYGKVSNFKFDSWNWLSCKVPAKDYIDDAYQFVFGTNSTIPVNHIFTAKKA